MTRTLARLTLALLAGSAALAQTPDPALTGTRPTQPNLGELTMPVQALSISKAPPPGTALLAGLPACGNERIQPGSSYVGKYAPPGGACLVFAGPTTDGRIAPREWVVETYGGAKPVTLTAATPQTPQLAGLFTVLRGSSDAMTMTPANTARESFEAAQERGEPEGRLTWRVRFAGMAYDPATTPREIIVVLTARDGAGSVKATDFRLFPYSPRIVSAASSNAVPMKPALLSVQLAGIGKAAEITLLSDTNVTGHCAWNEVGQEGQIWEGTVKVDERPRAIGSWTSTYSFTRSGAFISGAGAVPAQSCRPRLKVRFRFDRTTTTEPEILMSAPNTIALGARVLYTISQTGVLREKLGLFDPVDITQKLNMGTCSGRSEGPAGSFDVGRDNVNGDLSFRIRSGPIGTDCEYTDIRTGSTPIILPPGILLYDSTWSTSGGSPKCRAIYEPVEYSGPRFNPADFLVPDDSAFSRRPWTEAPNDLRSVWGLDRVLKYYDPAVTNDKGVVIHDSPQAAGFRDAMRSVKVWLKCDATAINDHQVRATLENVVFSGPEGWAGL